MADTPTLGIIGGSGLYNIAGLTDKEEHDLITPFGRPSDPVVVGTLAGQRVAFLARHGRGHRLTPAEVPYGANLYALKQLGVERVVAVSACGSLREDYAPGHIVIPDQVYDNTHGRPRSFFGEGLVAHVGVAEPFCPTLSQQLYEAVKATGATVHQGGAFITIEGPRFSTKAESNTYRKWGMSLVGMTTSPEVFLAREAELCYTCMAHVTDYDVWHVAEEAVTVEMIIRTLNANTATAQQALVNLLGAEADRGHCPCPTALAAALMTDPARVPTATKDKLGLLIQKYVA
ncbi:MAG: S-methyl-5'-thioadenosine phosphorylase [Anaerolineales bacterium]|nr:S-methyl-5'-thioadenosine phosphorylase [Anaerolineales bacterium]